MIQRFKSFFLSFVICSIVIAANSAKSEHKQIEPKFENFSIQSPVKEQEKCKPINLKLKQARSKKYRTMLREGAKNCPDFAGHYIVVRWGCGSNCAEVALIDSRNGEVHFAPFLERWGGDYHLNSYLYIVNPSPPPLFETSYWIWNGKQFTPWKSN